MRRALLVGLGFLLLGVPCGVAQNLDSARYCIVLPEDSKEALRTFYKQEKGQQALYIRIQFTVRRPGDDRTIVTEVAKDEIVVTEDGQRVKSLDIFVPKIQKLTAILAIDTSGSMDSSGKMEAAKEAAKTFLDKLDPRADVGLILFNHQLHTTQAPLGKASKDPQLVAEHREQLRRMIHAARPTGGTAYLDATAEALKMLKGIKGRKAVLVLTDGQDMNSRATLEQVVTRALGDEIIPVYTLGIGTPGSQEPVTTILVLDHSSSMRSRASGTDKQTKMQALHVAASRFIDLMRSNAQTTVLPFGSNPGKSEPFTDNKQVLKARIRRLYPKGSTALYRATIQGLNTLARNSRPGKKAVVVLTDGINYDRRNRYITHQTAIRRAQELKIPVHTLGFFGSRSSSGEKVLKGMASQTGGTYNYAGNQKKLIEVFEKLSIKLHDDGIDEDTLRSLAKGTGGTYYPARDVSKLSILYAQLADELQNTYTVTFRSRRSSHDGTTRGIQIQIFRDGIPYSDMVRTSYSLHGVVPPGLALWAYLVPLVGLGVLLVLPAGLRRLRKDEGAAT